MNDTARSQLRDAILHNTAALVSAGKGFEDEAYEDAMLSAVRDYVKNGLRLEGPRAEDAVADIVIDLYEQEHGLH